ncbi:hypothetical protein EMCRGX_G013803 [Ephydatia muelleri]
MDGSDGSFSLEEETTRMALLLGSTALLLNAIIHLGSPFLLSSNAVTCALSSLCVIGLRSWMNRLKNIPVIASVEVMFVLLGTIGLKALISTALGTQDDTHIRDLLWSKVTSYVDFYTQLYTCAPEWPGGCWRWGVMAVEMMLLIVQRSGATCWYREWLFIFMATMFMRLKLFLTPYLAVMSSLLISHKAAGSKAGLPMAMLGQHDFAGEFNDPDLEQLMLWINRSTVPNAVFAGTMPIMAAVKLSTERPIVNHPHFEHSEARIRTKLVYSMYSRRPPTEIHAILANMGVHFVIVDHSWCARDYRLGCSLYQVWDIEDVMNRGRPAFCEMISDQKMIRDQDVVPHRDTVLPFTEVFQNKQYHVLKVQ